MKTQRRFVSILAVLISVILLATACGSNNGNTSAPENNSSSTKQVQEEVKKVENEPVKLRITWWGSQERHEATQKALDLYNQLNPHVTFESEFSGWDGYFDKLGVQLSAKSAPDIIQMDAAYLNQYAANGLLEDLGSINVADVDPNILASGKVNGTLIAMPLGSAALGMAYDKTVVEKLGLKAPDFGWTWDDYYAFGEAAKAKLGADKYVIVDQSGDLVDYTAYQLSMGKGQIYTDEGKVSIDKDTWIGFMTKQKELRDKGILTPPSITVADKELDPNLDSVVKGDAIVRHIFANQAGSLISLKPDSIGFASFPKGSEPGGWLKPSMFWSVSKDSELKEEAKKFVEWFINDIEAGKILSLNRGIPINNKVVEALTPNFSDVEKITVDFIQKVAADSQPFKIDPEGYGNFKNDYKGIPEKIMFDRSTPEQGYEELLKLIKQYENN